jgi:NADH:ubiquinone oxidoreductase subunit D
MRGFNEFSEYKYKIKQFKLQNNFQFFNKIRQKLMEESQRIIRKHWLEYKKARVERMKNKTNQKVVNVKKQEKKSKFTKRTKRYKKVESPKKSPKKKGNKKKESTEN